ncbi:hypothetical protein QBC34DRAFT_398301 [Podospora aff. communis PSN243]|uniref:MARVEL domain-containing protein n=1 Tax=Podospora aff. communis PSN243 TaxID=3040156 RepID=A0AAV9GYM7_9PEZI|nr:hypothetical protein QBC34DRAFT_398301 [Podospora aff. communis PSN243]
MGSGSGTALHALSLSLRTIQLLSSLIILSLTAYFLATLAAHNLPQPVSLRAVIGIATAAILYTALGILTRVCMRRRSIPVKPFTSMMSMVLDVAFAAAFIFVAAANKGGSASCETGWVETPFGDGDVNTGSPVDGGLPGLGEGCRMVKACLAVGVVSIFMFLFSVVAEWALIRHHCKESRYGPSPANDYTEGYGTPEKKEGGGFWSRLFGRKKAAAPVEVYNPNALPQHAQPDDVRESYATEQTRVGSAGADGGPKYDALGYAGHDPWRGEPRRNEGFDEVPLAQYPPANYRYSDGVYERV